MKIYLIGFMASGKSTAGKELANALQFTFIDLDVYIEQKHNKSIKQIFELKGEDYFRIIENEALREVTALEGDYVIASGGGTSCFYSSVDFMNYNGITVYLKVEVSHLVSRLIRSKNDRPLLWGKNEEELSAYILRVLDERKKYYERAKIIVEATDLNVDQLAYTLKAALL